MPERHLSSNLRRPTPLAWIRLALVFFIPAAGGAATNSTVLFNRDIRPILSDRCFPCHGFDAAQRKAGLRLDTAEGQTELHEGRQAVKGGDLAGSELWRRVNSPDLKTKMPPPETGKTLTTEQVALLGRWIQEGAAFQKHWAFETPTRPGLPDVKDPHWCRNEVDRFVLSALEKKNLKPTPPAPKEMLVRRLALDLTGLPPDLRLLDDSLADTNEDPVAPVVEVLLASPRYGEHMARYWLDVARYGDTHGLHLDNERSMWAYRDWVVSAFNQNLPFDQFTIWQLAGDLLPEPSRDQLVASGFNRCNVSTSEGGAIDEEFQVRYAVDRVETTSTAWMGLTMGCAVCHDHKLDPITQKEFYEMFSIFNNIAENAMDGNALLPPPTMQVPTPAQEYAMAELDPAISGLEKTLQEQVASMPYFDPACLTDTQKSETREVVWIEDNPLGNATVQNGPPAWVTGAEGQVLSGLRALRLTGAGLRHLAITHSDSPLLIGPGDKLFASVFVASNDVPKALMLEFSTSDGPRRANWGDGEMIGAASEKLKEKYQLGSLPESNRWVRLEIDVARLGLRPGTIIDGIAFIQVDGTVYWDQVGQVVVNDPAQDPDRSLAGWEKFEAQLGDKSKAPQHIRDLLKKESAKRSEADRHKLREYFLSWVLADPDSGLLEVRAQLRALKDQRERLDQQIVSTMIAKERDKARPAWVLLRGQYDKHGEPVQPGVPAILPPLPSGQTTNRLTFARWLVDPQHPLTSRVVVNRLWQQFFGTGIVKTSEDFGTKGEWPSHPDLLDWLATEFIRSGWDVKHMVRLIINSATYRQDSRLSSQSIGSSSVADLTALDPENRLLARGPRRRLDAEALRDSALSISGLLNLTMGGRGVRSYQPPGIWEAVAYTTSNTAKYSQDHGDALYRRSLYLFWKRTAPPPSMTTLDAPSREQCRARRERTNTPLQALLMMNGTQYFEAARHLGYRMLQPGGRADIDRLKLGFRLTTSRLPTEPELAVLQETLSAHRARYRADVEAARKVISVGESPTAGDVPAPELAAYTMVANLLLNLDETVTNH